MIIRHEWFIALKNRIKMSCFTNNFKYFAEENVIVIIIILSISYALWKWFYMKHNVRFLYDYFWFQ